jgi:signal transduction histidine kinase
MGTDRGVSGRAQLSDRVARDLLGHVPLIALSVGPDLKVGPGGESRFAQEILGGGPLEGRRFSELVAAEGPAGPGADVLEDWLRLIFEKPDQDWETVVELCPLDEVRLRSPETGEEREFRLSYHPLRAGEGGPVVRVLVVGTDVTAERALAREIESRDREGDASVRRFSEVLKLGAETFRRFLNESQTRLAEAEGAAERLGKDPGDAEAARTLFRQAHTLKANARAFRLEWIAGVAESIEESLSDLRGDGSAPGGAQGGGAAELAIERLEELRVALDEAEELGATVFGRSLDPGETRARERDLEVPARVGRIESVLALAHGASALVSRGDEASSARAASLLKRICESLDDLRRIPARRLFQRFPKMVADLAAVVGKEVGPLRVSGSETLVNVRALDRAGAAVVHMLRNAVVHGIEPPGERLASGKPEAGTIALSLERADGDLVFEVADDGAGIDRGAVLARAVELGLVSEEEGRTADLARLLLLPGLTTAGKSGAEAGRGVGLDTVREAAEFLSGRAEIESEPGRGTRIRLVCPDRGPC